MRHQPPEEAANEPTAREDSCDRPGDRRLRFRLRRAHRSACARIALAACVVFVHRRHGAPPYGSKSRRTIARYAVESAQFLVREQGAEFLVIACNTASALALDAIQEAVPVPVLGVIEPGAAAAKTATRANDVLVIATDATVQSHAYAAACNALGLRALEKACPLLVPLVEEGWTEHPVTDQVIRIYLDELLKDAAAKGMHPDALVLGCTHYPLLRPLIERAVPNGMRVIDSADSAADAAVQMITHRKASEATADDNVPVDNINSLFCYRFGGKVRTPGLALPGPAGRECPVSGSRRLVARFQLKPGALSAGYQRLAHILAFDILNNGVSICAAAQQAPGGKNDR